jgi:hypothetical protein
MSASWLLQCEIAKLGTRQCAPSNAPETVPEYSTSWARFGPALTPERIKSGAICIWCSAK